MNTLVKIATSRGLHFLEVSAVRSFAGTLVMYGYARGRGIPLKIHDWRTLIVRVVAGTVALGSTFYALSILPLAEATALFSTTPIFIALLGWLVLGEKVSPLVGGALLFAGSGVVLILDPDPAALASGLVALIAAVSSAIAMISLRRLGSSETPEAIVIYFAGIAALLVGGVGLVEGVMVWPDALGGLVMLGTGVVATFAQLAMTHAYALDNAARVGAGSYYAVVFSTLTGVLLFNEPLQPTSALGIAIILVSGALLYLNARRSN